MAPPPPPPFHFLCSISYKSSFKINTCMGKHAIDVTCRHPSFLFFVPEYWFSSGQLQHGGSCLWSLPLWTHSHFHLFLHWGETMLPSFSSPHSFSHWALLQFFSFFPLPKPLFFNYSFLSFDSFILSPGTCLWCTFRRWTMTQFPPTTTISGKVDPSWSGTTSRSVYG